MGLRVLFYPERIFFEEVGPMRRKFKLFLVLIGISTILLASCDNDPEENRAVVIISSLNGNSPFASDVLDQGDSLMVTTDDFIQEDWIPVTFFNRPYNSVITTSPSGALMDVLITDYVVTWYRAGNDTIPPPFYGTTSVLVPSGEEVVATFCLVPIATKHLPFLEALQYNTGQILMTANIVFTGHELVGGREVTIPASLSVNFADYLFTDNAP
jgi:hypothetical protein